MGRYYLLPPGKRGPALKARLSGEAAIHKGDFDRDTVTSPTDRVATEHILTVPRPHFLKGAASTFLHRMFKHMHMRRGRMDLLRWISRYAIMKKRVLAAWMNTYSPLDPGGDHAA